MPRTASTSPYRFTRSLTRMTGQSSAPSGARCPRLPRLSLAVSSGQDAVHRPPGLGQHAAGRGQLARRARAPHLHHGHHHLANHVAKLDRRVMGHAGGGVPGRAELVGVRLGVRPALVGQGVHPAAALTLGADQPLVLKLLQRGVYRPRARPPHTVGAPRDLLDDLVTVPGTALGQQVEDRRPDIPAPGARSAPAELGRPERPATNLNLKWQPPHERGQVQGRRASACASGCHHGALGDLEGLPMLRYALW